ncbi:MAG: hypothetical protein ACTSYG_10790 [Candidatus Heimdallarchaeota archaeon]
MGRVVRNQKRLLEERGHKVQVISREDDLGYYSALSGFFPIWREVCWYQDYDVIISNDWSMALPLIFFQNHYCYFHGHNSQKVGRFIQTIIGRIKGKKLFVVGDSLKKRFPKSMILYNGVDRKEFYDMNKKRKYFGWIKKDGEIVTQTEMENKAKGVNCELSIAENIPPEKMNEWYNRLKYFASYPSKEAGFNLCWIEALAAGVPKVLGNENGIGITKAKENFQEFTWENNVDKLLEAIK